MIKDKEIEAWSSDELAKELTMLKQQLYYQMKLTVESWLLLVVFLIVTDV